jgi:hypothetical protein
VPDGLEGRLRWLFGGVAVVLVATGAFALLVPSTTEPAQASIDVLTGSAGEGAWSRLGVPSDAWLRALVTALLAAGVACFAAVGARIVRAPRRGTHLMPMLAGAGFAAFASGALAAQHAWRADASWIEPASVATGGLVLGVASVLGWLALWLADRPGDATARRDAELFDALLATLVPAGEGLELDATDDDVRARVVAAFAARSTKRRPALRLALRTLDLVTLLGHRRRFDAADRALRESIVASLATSRRPRLRALGATLNEIVVGAFWDDARVRAAVGEDATRVQALLESGPNAAAHRARREAAEEAAAAAERAAEALADDGAAGAAADGVPADVAPEIAAAAHLPDAARDAPPAVVAADAGVPQPEPARDVLPAPGSDAARVAPSPAAPRADAAAPSPASDGPKEIAPPAEELPFDRPWTLGVPAQEAAPRPMLGSVLRVARTGGPTRR